MAQAEPVNHDLLQYNKPSNLCCVQSESSLISGDGSEQNLLLPTSLLVL